MDTITIRPLTVADAAAYRDCRLRALRKHPQAFGMSYEEEAARSLDQIEERLQHQWNAPDNWMLGAFDGTNHE